MGRKMRARDCTICGTPFRPTGSRELVCSFVCGLEAKIQRADPDACWEWPGTRTAAGYGVIACRGEKTGAHRVALEQAIGAIGDLCALHRCDNPPCCNPAHLFAGDDADNLVDSHSKGRRAHVNYATGARHGRSRERRESSGCIQL